jgi:hypothetical protein
VIARLLPLDSGPERAADARGAIQIKTYQHVTFVMTQPGSSGDLTDVGACRSSGDTIGWLRLIPRLEHVLARLAGELAKASRKNAQAKGVVMAWTAGYGPWTAEHDGMWLGLISS